MATYLPTQRASSVIQLAAIALLCFVTVMELSPAGKAIAAIGHSSVVFPCQTALATEIVAEVLQHTPEKWLRVCQLF